MSYICCTECGKPIDVDDACPALVLTNAMLPAAEAPRGLRGWVCETCPNVIDRRTAPPREESSPP